DRDAGPVAQLLRAGRESVGRGQAGAGQSVLRARARLGALSHGGDRDGGDGDRVAGVDLGGVLADAAGGAARLLAARPHRAHVGARGGADLHSRDQLGVDGGVRGAGHRVPEVGQPGGGVRHRGDGDDDHHVVVVFRGGAAEVGLVAHARGPGAGDVPDVRSVVPRGERQQGRVGWLVPAGGGGGGLHHHYGGAAPAGRAGGA